MNGSIKTTEKTVLTGSINSKGRIAGQLDNSVFISDEVDPTVPVWVKSITQEDIENWDSGAGVVPISFETIEEIVNGTS